jgi:glycosyltransferase involved in cell wall biosynthesis
MISASSSANQPLVSVIVPVRNGERSLKLALDGLLRQSYGNLEILISDNGSTDSSFEIAAHAAASDTRVRLVRQVTVLTAIENFRYWLNAARGSYVMFAAHDDLRNADFVANLVGAAAEHADAVCVLPSVWTFSQHGEDPFLVESPVMDRVHHFATKGLGWLQRFGFVLVNGYPMYGLLRADVVKSYAWHEIDYAPDVPFVLHVVMSGEVVLEETARFYYCVPDTPKSARDRAQVNSLRSLRPFPEMRLAWVAGKAASLALRRRGKYLPLPVAMCIAYFVRRTAGLRVRLNARAPAVLRQGWRQLKSRLGWRLN